MQYVQGETLAARLERTRLTVSEVLEIAIPVADGLAEAHVQGVVHRYIKPQNIMITPRGQAKILDFGLAKATADANADIETEGGTVTSVKAMLLAKAGNVSFVHFHHTAYNIASAYALLNNSDQAIRWLQTMGSPVIRCSSMTTT
jgi:serine/threonine protein kinase